jgi:hypothetical protein
MITDLFLGAILLVLVVISLQLHFIDLNLVIVRNVLTVMRGVMYIEYPYVIGRPDNSIDTERRLMEELARRGNGRWNVEETPWLK